MRMTRGKRRIERGERGAVLVLVGAFTMVMIAMTAFVIDIGNQRQNRIQLTSATDAAALDVADAWAGAKLVGADAGFSATANPAKWDCTVVARTMVRANNDGLDPTSVSCIAEYKDEDWGVVTVAASEAVTHQFGQAIGTPTGMTRATTSVKVTGAAQGGLRPWAICANLPEIRDFINGTAVDDVKIDAVKFLTPQCGQASGNWGLLDLGGNGASAVARLFAEGYAKPVKVSRAKDVCEDTVPESCFSASPGAKWNSGPIRDALDFLDGAAGCDAGGPEFSVPVYEQVLDPHGKNTKFPLTGFLRVQLMCFTTGGSNLNSLTVKLVSFDAEQCCSGISATNRFLEICDVGTIAGDLGSDFESSCGTRAEPPVVDNDCEVIPLDPPYREVVVDGSGASTGPLQVDVLVEDASFCGSLGLRTVAHGTEEIRTAPAPFRSGNLYRFTFPAGTTFGPGGTNLNFIVFEDDFVWDQSAALRTVTDVGTPPAAPTCEVISVSPLTHTVNVENSSKKTTAAVTWTLEFKWPSNCGTITGKLIAGSTEIGVGTTDVSAIKKFTLPAGTQVPSGMQQGGSFQVRFFNGATQLTMPGPMTLYTS